MTLYADMPHQAGWRGRCRPRSRWRGSTDTSGGKQLADMPCQHPYCARLNDALQQFGRDKDIDTTNGVVFKKPNNVIFRNNVKKGLKIKKSYWSSRFITVSYPNPDLDLTNTNQALHL